VIPEEKIKDIKFDFDIIRDENGLIKSVKVRR
jgi:hypothetical protein